MEIEGGALRSRRMKELKKGVFQYFWAMPSMCECSISGNAVDSRLKEKNNKTKYDFYFSWVQITDFEY